MLRRTPQPASLTCTIAAGASKRLSNDSSFASVGEHLWPVLAGCTSEFRRQNSCRQPPCSRRYRSHRDQQHSRQLQTQPNLRLPDPAVSEGCTFLQFRPGSQSSWRRQAIGDRPRLLGLFCLKIKNSGLSPIALLALLSWGVAPGTIDPNHEG